MLLCTLGFNSFVLNKPRPWSERTHNKLFGVHCQGSGGLLGWQGGSQVQAPFMFADGYPMAQISSPSFPGNLL